MSQSIPQALSMEQIYFLFPAMSRSVLNEYRKDPDNLKKIWSKPKELGRRKYLTTGKAFEKLILEPNQFATYFDITDKPDLRKERAYVKAIREQGKEPLKRNDYEKLLKMRDAFLKIPLRHLKIYDLNTMGDLLQQPFRTQVMRVFKYRDVRCKCLIDIYLRLRDGRIFLGDIKTSYTVTDSYSFFEDAIKYGYDIQAAFYLHGFKQQYGEQILDAFPFYVANTRYIGTVNEYSFQKKHLLSTVERIEEMLDKHIEVNV